MVFSVNNITICRNNLRNHYGSLVSFEGKKKGDKKPSPANNAHPEKGQKAPAYMTTAERVYIEQTQKAARIDAIIEEAMKNGATLTIDDIAQKTGLSHAEVASVIYRRTPLINKDHFDQVKNTTHRPHPATKEEADIVGNFTRVASSYGVSTPEYPILPETDYVRELANLLKRLALSEESVKVIEENFPKAPAFTDMLLSLKKNGGHMRCQSVAPKTLTDLYKAHEINPDLTEELLAKQDKNGDYCHSLLQVPKIVVLNEYSPKLLEIAKEAPVAVYDMYKMDALSTKERSLPTKGFDDEKDGLNYSSELINETPRYSPDELIGLYARSKELPELTNRLMTDTMIDEVWYPRFSGQQICYILEQYQNYPDLVNTLIDAPGTSPGIKYRFKAGQICTILKQNEKTPKLISSMVNDKTDEYVRGLYNNKIYRIEPANSYTKSKDYRFSAYNICEILKYYDNFPNLLTRLVKATTKTPDGKTVYKYDDYQILNILENVQANQVKKD